MKRIQQSLAILALAALSTTAAFAGKVNGKFVVNSSQSTLNWKGEKVTGEHSGTVQIAGGELTVVNDQFKAGTFTINMSSITVTDIKDPGTNAKLLGHLKSDDFFSTAKHTTSTFVVTSIAPTGQAGNYVVKGNLTIKGITQAIEFPASIVINGKNLMATATIKVDRTKFDIKYGSKSFFESIGDKAIYDEFTMDLKLVATLQ